MNLNNWGKSRSIVQKIQANQSDAGKKRQQETQQAYELHRKYEMMGRTEMQQKTEIQAQSEMQQKIEMQSKAEIQQKNETQIQSELQQKIEVHQWSETKQKSEILQQIEPEKKVDEKKKDEYQTLAKKYENKGEKPIVQNHRIQNTFVNTLMNERINEDKKQIQHELMECSRTIRDIQSTIKETYQFKPCRQLCELLINIRQNVYTKIEDVQEDLGYVLEGFGIVEFTPQMGDVFEAKCHDQVYSNVQDARGKEIERVYSSGFRMDGDVIMKAQVSVKQ